MTEMTPKCLDELADEIGNVGEGSWALAIEAAASAWEADRKQVVDLNRQLQHADNRIGTLLADRQGDRSRIEALEVQVRTARNELIHLRNWADQSQTGVTARQVADAVMRICETALAALAAKEET